jgi:adenosylhomocysteinase
LSYESLFAGDWYQRTRAELPLVGELIARYADERPFNSIAVAFGHILVANSIPCLEALVRGGARVFLGDTIPGKSTAPIKEALRRCGIAWTDAEQAAAAGDLFLDVCALLGRRRTPRAASELSRTGVVEYSRILCPVMSADDTRVKQIEAFFGCGDGFLRALRHFCPERSGPGTNLLVFGYGKIGRGLAFRARALGMRVSVIDSDPPAVTRAGREGFDVTLAAERDRVRRAVLQADVIAGATGVHGAVARTADPAWIRARGAVLCCIGAEDEFGPSFSAAEILGGKGAPLNHHLPEPTANRYIDPTLAAHLLGLEELARRPGDYLPGVHALPAGVDDALVTAWRRLYPDEDVSPAFMEAM